MREVVLRVPCVIYERLVLRIAIYWPNPLERSFWASGDVFDHAFTQVVHCALRRTDETHARVVCTVVVVP